MSTSIRHASTEDAAALAELVAELGYAATPAEVIARLNIFSADDRFLVLVAESPSGRILGWINAERRTTLESGSFHEVIGLVVSSQARRLGIGASLLDAAEQWASSQGGQSVTVRSNVIRPESHAFYEGNGYSRRKSQHCYRKTLRAMS